MEEEFQLITTLFKWTMGHSWKLQAPFTVLTTLSVNISAHNCAGQSDKQILTISYVEGTLVNHFG